jgi:hypothetical protein
MVATATQIERRPLVREDVRQMDLPVHFWYVRRDQITAQIGGDGGGALADRIDAYLEAWRQNRRAGRGFLFVGANGVGKTAAAVVIGKAFKGHGETVLFVSAGTVMSAKIEGTWWSDDTTYWEWCKEVDVLILDDLGKGSDGSGYAAIMWDELLRHRHDHRYVTIITTNLALTSAEADDGIGLDKVLKRSTIEVLKESVTPLRLHGVNRRDA